MALVDRQITIDWWERLLKDEEKLVAWLQKLQVTEADGYYSNIKAIQDYDVEVGTLAYRVFETTANDEQRHSDLLMNLLRKRGTDILDNQAPTSLYWEMMDTVVTSAETFAAMTHMGEKLAAERFEIIQQHEGTPRDVLDFINSALPDEKYHARAYKAVTTTAALQLVQAQHELALAAIMKGRK